MNVVPDQVILAHPLTEAGRLPVSPLVVAAAAVLVVAGVAMIGATARDADVDVPDAAWYHRPLTPASAVGRTAAVVLLIAAVLAGRLGANRPPANIASVVIMGIALPVLVVAALAFGRVWERLDPWDGLARLLGRFTNDAHDVSAQPQPVTWAVPFALIFGWYISAFGEALLPRWVALAVAGYTIVTLAGCLAMGRITWLTRAEVLGIVLRAVGRLRGQRLGAWAVPAGTWAVVGIVAGGFLFAIVRYSELWTPLSFRVSPEATDIIGFSLCALAVAGVLGALESRAHRVGAMGTPTAAAVPAVAGLALAASLSRGQFLIAVQLLPAVVDDPLGRGWHLFGFTNGTPTANPLGDAWHITLQVLLLVVGGALGARVARQRAEESEVGRSHALGVVAAASVVVLGILAVTTV